MAIDATIGDVRIENYPHENLGTDPLIVVMNKEYSGHSILDNISQAEDQHMEAIDGLGDEQEVNSDQSNKSRSLISTHNNESILLPSVHMQNLELELGMNDWEKFVANPVQILWPEVWGELSNNEVSSNTWNDRSQNAKYLRKDVDVDVLVSIHNLFNLIPAGNEIGICLNLFSGNERFVEEFKSWLESITPGKLLVGEEEKSDCEEGVGSIKRKKRSKKGGKKKHRKSAKNVIGLEGIHQEERREGASRKKYKIWSSKNRKPEKNLSLKKVTFTSVGTLAPVQLLGFGDFKVGHDKQTGRNSKVKEHVKTSRSSVGNFYKEAREVEDRLMQTVGHINSKDNNSKVLTSIQNMKSCKLSKFSARLNEDGEVSIDENMMDNGKANNEDEKTKCVPQERILNTRFNTRLSQEQRFEAKKYVLDKLVPLQPILSGWPKTLLEYFRSLCNLYNFGDGYLATAYETEYIEDQEIHNMQGAEESMEEVFSETDATAKFMTSDIQGSYHHTELNDVVLPEGQAREGHEMTLEDVHVPSN
ncbi:hypothetical protein L1987_64524 [Smallanthus sonchifolius]|uniref:Uncharacterized protein n=1 Tax=Smallanthus sonchifolius TaxID=185202 RepID=A0ACB9BRU7_9ASTR|nr:hypothetical protein L1987_64524 [Smallanthus sonchifolius]